MKVIYRIPPILLYFLVSLSPLTETIYSSALPTLTNQLNTDGGIAQLSTTVYYIGFSIGIFTLGYISDIYGRRPVILFGLLFYIIATFLISMSTTIEFFIAMRALQAYGASVGSVVAQAMARDSYKNWELSYIYASVSMIISIVPVIGSTIGGYIIESYQEWRYVFYFLIMFSGSLLVLYIKYLPETNAYVANGQQHKFYDVFKSVFKDKILLCYAFIVGAYNGICLGFFIQAPFIFIDKFQMHPTNYGKLFLILTVANLSGGFLCRRLIKKFVSTSKIKLIGFGFSSVGCLLLLCGVFIVQEDSSITLASIVIFAPLSIHLVGHALIVPMILRKALENYSKVLGSAGAIFGASYYIITAIISFLISIFHSNNINNYAYIFAFMLSICLILFNLTTKWTKETKVL